MLFRILLVLAHQGLMLSFDGRSLFCCLGDPILQFRNNQRQGSKFGIVGDVPSLALTIQIAGEQTIGLIAEPSDRDDTGPGVGFFLIPALIEDFNLIIPSATYDS